MPQYARAGCGHPARAANRPKQRALPPRLRLRLRGTLLFWCFSRGQLHGVASTLPHVVVLFRTQQMKAIYKWVNSIAP